MTAVNARRIIDTTEFPTPVVDIPSTPDATFPDTPDDNSPTPNADIPRAPWDERAVAAATRYLINPRRHARAARALILIGTALHSRAGLLLVAVLAVVWDTTHDRRIRSSRQRWRRINARQKRMKAHKKTHITIGIGKDKWKIRRPLRTPIAVVKAVWFETGLTEHQRDDAWLGVTSERLAIDPRIRFIRKTINLAQNEVWELGVPIGPRMNPSILVGDNYAAGIKGCVRGTCYGVNIYPSTDRGGIAYMHIERHNIRDVDAGPSPLITHVKELEPIINTPKTIAAPVQIGKTAMRQPFLVNLMDRSGIGIFGQNGTGKSVLLHTFACHILTAHDATARLGDMKDGMDGAYYRGANLLYTEEPSEVHEWISEYVVPAERTKTEVLTWRRGPLALERAKYLQRKNLRNWEPGCGLDADFLIIDEVDGVLKDDQFALAWMINKLRAIGVRVIYATQLPRADTLDKRLSSATNVRISFRVSDVVAANVALGSGAVGRGYDASKLPVPGYCYVLGSTEQDATIVRTHMLEDRDVKLIASAFPRPVVEQCGESSDSAPDLTVSDPPMEGVSHPDSVIVRSPLALVPPHVDPPPECADNDRLMAVWNRMPAARKDLAAAGEYQPEYVSAILRRWEKEGRVLNVRGQWTHRAPRP